MHFFPVENPNILTTRHRSSTTWEPGAALRDPPPMDRWPPSLRNASPKRKLEFAAGRWCAAQAIHSCDPALRADVGFGPDRAPRWPADLIGSITHAEGFASAAVAPRIACLGLGIDSESLDAFEVTDQALEAILCAQERRLHRGSLSQTEFHALMFSAKESIYKCLYPLADRPLDYSAFVLERIDAQKGVFNFRIVQPLSTQLNASFCGEGRFEFSRGCVHTGIELPRPRPIWDGRRAAL